MPQLLVCCVRWLRPKNTCRSHDFDRKVIVVRRHCSFVNELVAQDGRTIAEGEQEVLALGKALTAQACSPKRQIASTAK